MIRRIVLTVILIFILTITSSASVKAASMPVAGCPTGFMMMEIMPHADAMAHMHAGLTADLNQDGYLCMQKATGIIHVHMDNVVVVR
jgi:hypothetical protein